ncbi:hypothetical protein PHLGIDRAFT_15250 [Phlebiopsis gigantea 11061_1 CR5-6]|uniref:F-box domain-containing protein n=1 Tax=Phlebiopsis gigantea (strain 11061_1 CR5-6) TaxID=745531 RepID=A0A0C3NHQ6_PHLG1|nr:hypothetical protein PHLGIDRAFT_15250 [Phlebiopsis gigantea 11061_1 CR5-6]
MAVEGQRFTKRREASRSRVIKRRSLFDRYSQQLFQLVIMYDVPTEIVDVVFGNLHSYPWEKGLDVQYHEETHGKPHLRACSLVSRSWNAVARRHLFRDIVYSFKRVPPGHSNPENLDSNHPYGKWSPAIGVRWKTFWMFCEFLRTNSDVRRYIIRLKLDAYAARGRARSGGLYDAGDFVPSELFVELIQSLPRLHTLLLYNVVLVDRPPPTLSIRPSLSRLCVSYCAEVGDQINSYRTWSHRNGPETGTSIVECFAKAEVLHLLDFYAEADTMDGTAGPPECTIEMESLILEDLADTRRLAQYLVTNPKLESLRKLTLDAKPASQVAQLLSTVGPQLEELTYAVRFAPGPPDMPIALEDFPNLHILTLGLHFDEASLRFHANPVLEQLVVAYTLHGPVKRYVPHLKEITIHVDLEGAVLSCDSPDQTTIAGQMLWHSFQEALLNIVKQLSLPGISMELRSLNDYLGEEQARDIVGGVFKHLNDSDKILWRDKCDSQWPLLW